jgi:hypothetical protein
VVVNDFGVFGSGVGPSKADPPLLVNADAVVAGPITFEFLEPIARWHPEISDYISSIQNQKLA